MFPAFDEPAREVKELAFEENAALPAMTEWASSFEVASDQVSVRTFGGGEQQKMETMSFDAFAQRLTVESRFP